MDKVINYIQELELELNRLSGLCDVLSCAGDSGIEPAMESVGDSFFTLRDMLSDKAAEIDRVVLEYYKNMDRESVNN